MNLNHLDPPLVGIVYISVLITLRTKQVAPPRRPLRRRSCELEALAAEAQSLQRNVLNTWICLHDIWQPQNGWLHFGFFVKQPTQKDTLNNRHTHLTTLNGTCIQHFQEVSRTESEKGDVRQ